MLRLLISIMILGLLNISCSDNFLVDSGKTGSSSDTLGMNDSAGIWTIPKDEVFNGGPGKDGIPSIDNPKFVSAQEADYLDDDDLILGYKEGSHIRAYPHKILSWHEIVNDKVGNNYLAITFCPLTGTGIGWDRKINDTLTTFGVSGLLYNANLIPYDRNTDSYWSQILSECVHGKLADTKVKTHQIIETTWGTWKKMFESTKVLSTNTGYNRNYQRTLYENHSGLLFPINPLDKRLPETERVLGIVKNRKAKAYQFRHFSDSIRVITDTFQGQEYLIAGSKDNNFLVAYKKNTGENRTYTAVQNAHPVVMKDDKGNKYNIFGEVVSGPDKGNKLKETNSFTGYWFSWGAFFPDLPIYKE